MKRLWHWLVGHDRLIEWEPMPGHARVRCSCGAVRDRADWP